MPLLTPRELQIVELLILGVEGKREIAAELGMDPATVSRHLRRARIRFGLRTNAQIGYAAVHSGQIRLSDYFD